MAQPPTRSIFSMIFKNFINSLKPRQIRGTLKGKDNFGNKYFEIAANPSLGKRRDSRWFEPLDKEEFQPEMPAEWESWLRGRRKDPPSEEEILRNVAIIEMKRRNAVEVEKKAGVMTPHEKGMETFPKRPEFEIMPGKPQDEK